jgi:hypothetical protein
MSVDEEIAYHIKQAFREFCLALRAETEVAKISHLEVSGQHHDVVQRLLAERQAEMQLAPCRGKSRLLPFETRRMQPQPTIETKG